MQFTYMHPKGLAMRFQKMVIGYDILWLAVLEILEFEEEEFFIF